MKTNLYFHGKKLKELEKCDKKIYDKIIVDGEQYTVDAILEDRIRNIKELELIK